MARLEGPYEQVSQRLINIDLRLDGLDRKIDLFRDALDKKVDAFDAKADQRSNALDAKIDTLEAKIDAKIDQHLMWTIGIILTAWLTSTGATITAVYLHH